MRCDDGSDCFGGSDRNWQHANYGQNPFSGVSLWHQADVDSNRCRLQGRLLRRSRMPIATHARVQELQVRSQASDHASIRTSADRRGSAITKLSAASSSHSCDKREDRSKEGCPTAQLPRRRFTAQRRKFNVIDVRFLG